MIIAMSSTGIWIYDMLLYMKMYTIFLIAVYLCIWIKCNRHSRAQNLLSAFVMCLYVFDVLSITILRQDLLETQTAVLIPGKAYGAILTESWIGLGKYVARELIGNVLLFLPLGLFLTKKVKVKHCFWTVGLIAFCLSLGIESTQYERCVGTFEVDDLIHNTWGAVMGSSICKVLQQESNWKSRCKVLIPVEAFAVLLGMVSLWGMVKDMLA